MTIDGTPPASLTSRLIALSQLTCVVLFGVLLLRPWQATSPVLGAALMLACAAFGAAALSIARPSRGLVRVVFGAFALLAFGLGVTMFSGLPSLRLFGRVCAITLLASLVGDLIFLPATVAFARRYWPVKAHL